MMRSNDDDVDDADDDDDDDDDDHVAVTVQKWSLNVIVLKKTRPDYEPPADCDDDDCIMKDKMKDIMTGVRFQLRTSHFVVMSINFFCQWSGLGTCIVKSQPKYTSWTNESYININQQYTLSLKYLIVSCARKHQRLQ